MFRVLVIGDSLVEGVGDYEQQGWASRLSSVPGIQVSIDGVGGRTALDVLSVISNVSDSFDLALVQVGLNDSRYRDTLGRSEVPLADYCAAISNIVLLLQNSAARVAILGLTRVNEDLSDPYKPDKSYRNALIDTYDSQLRAMASSGAFDYVPVPTLLDDQNLLYDGLHPSTEGHERILESVLAYIDARLAQGS